jgi:hypothetical protein
MHMQFLGVAVDGCKSEALRKLKREHGTVQAWGQRL